LISIVSVLPSITLQEHQGSDKTWVWHASDFSDGELKDELFCIRFGGVESKFFILVHKTDLLFYDVKFTLNSILHSQILFQGYFPANYN
jgi:hypothetical protein